jgi:RNA polymerase sigma-70 factor (ECF subfamily)
MEHEGENDWEWVCKVQGGETDAFETLVRRHEKNIFNLLYRWLGDYHEAGDVAQEVFISAYRAIKSFRGESSFSTWLYRIAINQAKNRRKSLSTAQQRMVPVPLDGTPDPPHPGSDPAQQAEQQEVHEQVQQAIDGLRPDDAAMILLHDLQDVPYEEIARILEIPLGTVKSRLHRARQALKARLAPYYHSLKAPQ